MIYKRLNDEDHHQTQPPLHLLCENTLLLMCCMFRPETAIIKALYIKKVKTQTCSSLVTTYCCATNTVIFDSCLRQLLIVSKHNELSSIKSAFQNFPPSIFFCCCYVISRRNVTRLTFLPRIWEALDRKPVIL